LNVVKTGNYMECCHTENYINEKEKHVKDDLYTCPMHPEVLEHHPGMCPECGMQLVPTSRTHAEKHTEKHGHAQHHTGHNIYKRKFLVSLIATIPVILYSGLM